MVPTSAWMLFGSYWRLPFLLETLTTCTLTMPEGAGDEPVADDVTTAATAEPAELALSDPYPLSPYPPSLLELDPYCANVPPVRKRAEVRYFIRDILSVKSRRLINKDESSAFD